MRKNIFVSLLVVLSGLFFYSCQESCDTKAESLFSEFRAPSYPLVTIDPYISAWSNADHLFDKSVSHWTGKTHGLIGALRVDGKVYRFLGKEDIPWKSIVPLAQETAWQGKYTTNKPKTGWEKKEFNEIAWKNGAGAFGSEGFPALGTVWETENIWIRREFQIPNDLSNQKLFIKFSHDDDFELYLNGKEVVSTGNKAKRDVVVELDRSLLNIGGNNVFAAHCLNRMGPGYVDFGLFIESEQIEVFNTVAIQKSVALSATKTQYKFTCGAVDLKLQFVSPLLPDDLDLLSRPVNYMNYELVSTDGGEHDVQIFFEATPEWAVNDISQEVEISKGETNGVNYLKAGTVEQSVLGRKGDDVRIDWGHFYLAANQSENSSFEINGCFKAKESFAASGELLGGVTSERFKMTHSMPSMAYVNKVGTVTAKSVSGYVMLGYDDVESIQYFGDNLKAWWTKDGQVSFDDVLQKASAEHNEVIARCTDFDNQLRKETSEAGGEKYADLCVLAFRQSITAHKLVKDTKGEILFLSKENFSNGSIGTVDVTYPSAPLYLKYNPELLKGMLNPIFYYSESGKWTKPFAAHDVGTYPLANGQTYGGDMPVEECGNMVILTAAIAEMEGNANYAESHWKVLTIWANYLLENGLDPDNQLCTDDFAGHFAHNTNLSVKAIMGIAGYGKLAKTLGKEEIAEKYTTEAKMMAAKWVEMANDGDHYRLTFDQPGTWSQKYNLVWDKLLNLDIFPAEVAQKEVAYYLTKQNKFGLPLDNRRTYTKSDWIIWTATLANDKATFQQFIDPVYGYVTNTPDRVPMSDWYETPDAKQVGFQARSVVGGYFIKLLE